MKIEDVNAATVGTSATPVKEEGGKPPAEETKDAVKASETSADEKMPWHKDARFQEFLKDKKELTASANKLQALLKANDLDDPDDLEDLVASGKVVKGKLADLNQIDALIAKATRLDQYEAYWAAEKERKEREESDPITRAERAERRLAEQTHRQRAEEHAKRQATETKAAIGNYEKEVRGLISDIGHPKDQEPFILEIFGVNNPSNDVDIYDKKAIKRLVTEGQKKVDAFKQSVIAEYLKSKKEVVKTGGATEATTTETAAPVNLKTARKALAEAMANAFRGA